MQTRKFPVFPLPNLVFFPKVIIPLHIFEPRYRIMIQDILEHEQQIGMLLLKKGWEKDYFGTPETFRIGCVGAIEAFEKLPMGRFNVLLRGIQKFEVVNFTQHAPYRCVEARMLRDEDFNFTRAEKSRLFRHLWEISHRYARVVLQLSPAAVFGEVQEGDLEALINQTAMILDIDIFEKQKLLELPSLEKRYYFIKQTIDERLAGNRLLHQVDKLDFDPIMN